MEILIVVCIVFWAMALVHLCIRRDIEIHSKLSWVVTILVLNALGALLYVLFGPRRVLTREQDPEVPPFQPEGTAWNPILGENRFADGEGLNPKKDTSPNQPPEETR